MLCINIYEDLKKLCKYCNNITIQVFHLYIAGYIRGYEKIWIIGDNFTRNTIHDHLKGIKKSDGTPNTYLYCNYEVRDFSSSPLCGIRNILSRLKSCLIGALNEHASLPKMVVFVLDDDLITNVKEDSRLTIRQHYDILLNGLLRMVYRAIQTYKDLLPQKSKCDNILHVLWIAPPTHKYFTESNNERRVKYTSSLSTAVALQQNMSMLKMVKFWDHDDPNLFLYDPYRYTSDGLTKYWMSVDASVRFWNVALAKKFDRAKAPEATNQDIQMSNIKREVTPQRGSFNQSRNRSNSRFSWKSPSYRGNKNNRRRLSTPP